MTGKVVGPFWPICVGNVKQFGLMNWCGARFDVGSHVTIGVSAILGVPRSEVLLMFWLVPGILAPLRFKPKVWPLWPVRLTPLWSCVIPETCQLLTRPPAHLFLANFLKV